MNNTAQAAYGDVVLFSSQDRKSYIRRLAPGERLATHLGNILFDDLIGIDYGERIKTHLGNVFFMLQPSFEDLLQHSRHETTIIQPKDLGYIAVKMNIQSGVRVVEAGTGSGGLTTWLSLLVGDSGQVFSYDRKASNADVAKRNLSRTGTEHRVTFKTRDIANGFDETDADSLFLDVVNPWDYLMVARAALKNGGYFGALVPTMNQVIDLTTALFKGPWFRVEVEEIIQRAYKVVPARMRPDEHMVGHTGYLIFARAVARSSSEEAEAVADIEDTASMES